MMETRFTPGPWHFVPENAGLMFDHGYGILYGEPDAWGWEKNLFVSVGCSGNVKSALGEGAAEANAHLISAAPDLYAALDRAWNLLCDITGDGHLDIKEQCSAALSKARGES